MPTLAQRVDTLVTDMIAEFRSGELGQFASHFDFPLPLHLESRLILMRRPGELIAFFEALAEERREKGLASVTAEVVALELPRNHRFRAWAHHTHFDADGRVASQSDRILYCRDRGGRIVIEMMDVTRAALSSVRGWPKQPGRNRRIR